VDVERTNSMETIRAEISVKGKIVRVPAVCVNGILITTTGRIVKIARIEAENYLEKAAIGDPLKVIEQIKRSQLHADIFTFKQHLPEIERKYPYYYEYDNIAAIDVKSYDDWWKNKMTSNARNWVRKAAKRGVTVKKVAFNDELVKGIVEIYNETPVRQGRTFWHYGKEFQTIKKENGTFLDRSDFIAAYYGDELIGFIKLVYTDKRSEPMQILSKIAHQEKAPTNAMLAKALELTAQKKIPYFLYGKYAYGKKGTDSVSDFKRHNGFKRIDLPQYYVPLTVKGRIALILGLHREISEILPQRLLSYLLKVRSKWYGSKKKPK
jgi:hypothetical protein